MKKLSLATKTIIISIGCVILLELCVVIVSAYYLNKMKNGLVTEALQFAEKQGREIADYISKESNITHLSEFKDKSAISSYIKILLRENDAIVYALVVDEKGNVYTQDASQKEGLKNITTSKGKFSTTLPKNPSSKLQLSVEQGTSAVHTIRLPIKKNNEMLGELLFNVSKESLEKRLSATSNRISEEIAALIIIITIITLVAFFLLTRIFRHHLEIIKRTEQMDRMGYIGTLAAGLVHEIRNPLNAMNVNFQLIKEEIEQPIEDSSQRTNTLVNKLQGEIQSLNKLLTNFLSFAVPTSSQKTTFKVIDLLDETVDFFSAEFTKRNVVIHKEHNDNDTILHGDRNALRQVLFNIIINAIQAMEKKEKILTFHIEKSNTSSVILSISDNGTGIQKSKIGKIFDIFYTTKPGGSGFGLAIAKRIVNDHKGKIWVKSFVGEGTTFYIELPSA